MIEDDELNESVNELKEQLSELAQKLDELEDSIESTVESAVEDAVEGAVSDAVEDALGDASCNAPAAGTGLYIFTQDGKSLIPFGTAEAYRIKKGEEPYVINIQYGNQGRRAGKYPDKAAALEEMRNIAGALERGERIYRMK